MVKKLGKKAKIVLITLLIAVVAAGSGFGIFAIWASNTDVLAGTDIRLIAHRGHSDKYTENTLVAFEKAAESDTFYGIETDVHATADGYLVCNHDAEVHYDDGTDLTILENTLETLMAKPVKSKFGTGEKIALFDDYLLACQKSGKRAIIEIKAPLTEAQLVQVLAAVDKTVGRANITVISFLFDQLELVKTLDSSIYMMYLVMNPFEINRAIDNGYSIGVYYLWATAPMVADFHKKGLEVNAWTCDDKVSIAMMKIAGVDYITTNCIL